jgi:predicted 2-oxoglutarate/Fe(II)-dependent dioxygenase YbiX
MQALEIFHYKNAGLDYFIVDNFFDKNELSLIKTEALDLQAQCKPPKETLTAVIDGKELKTGTGIFISQVFDNLEKSTIYNCMAKICEPSFVKYLKSQNCLYSNLENIFCFGNLINYYKNGQYYDSHFDTNAITAIFFLKDGEYSGGEFCFDEYNEVIESKENRLVLFSGMTKHKVMPVISNSNGTRISITTFINAYKPNV